MDVRNSNDEKSSSTIENPVNLAPIGPGNYDRAWNDPPMFDTKVNLTAKAPANKLNKRVAYPISASQLSSGDSSSPVRSPPTGTPVMPPLPPSTTGQAPLSTYMPKN